MDVTPHGAILRRLRDEAELSMAQLAALSGVSKPSIQIYEQGTVPNVGAAMRLARALGVQVEDIWGGLVLPTSTDEAPTAPEAA